MRILIVSYYFPPYNSVGAVRPGKLAEYLHEKGHEVHVIAGHDQPFPLGSECGLPLENVIYCAGWSINTPVELLSGGRAKVASQGFGEHGNKSVKSKLGRLYKTFFHWPDAQIGWINSATIAGKQLLARKKLDLIYVSAPAFSGLIVARRLSKLTGVPWVAEFRDLWTDNHNYQYPGWRKWIESKWESSLLYTASALISVSMPLVHKLKRFGKPIWEIRNGFDPNDAYINTVPAGYLSEGLNIVFTGNVYPQHYDLNCFCAALEKYRLGGGVARVHVAGRNTSAFLEAATASNVDDLFIFHSTVERPVALSMQKCADLLLTFLWDGGSEEGIYSTKLFEYAGAGRPILAIGSPQSDVGVLLESSGIGKACLTVDDLLSNLIQMQETKAKTGELIAKPKNGFDFTRQVQFEILEANLQTLLNKSLKG